MRKRLFTRSSAAILALSFGMVSPVLAQAIQKDGKGVGVANRSASATDQNEQGPASGQTGTGQRGTKIAPSTQPGKATQPKTAETGVEPRGTKVAPSTNPGQTGEQTR